MKFTNTTTISEDQKRLQNAMIFGVVLFALLAIGVSFVYSSSALLSMRKFDTPWRYLEKQVFGIAVGIVMMTVFYLIKIEWIRPMARIGIALSIVLLILVFIPPIGLKLGRAYRWIRLAGFSFQPSELVKFTLPLYLVDAICRKEELKVKMVRGLLPLLTVSGVILTLIFMEPDFGTAVVILVITFTIIFVGGVALKYLGLLSFLLSVGIFFAVRMVSYRWNRILAFVDPFADPFGKGYQILQSHRAFASGGFFGVGLGKGVLKRGYLPEPYADFIFACIGEETGLLGGLIVIGLFIVLGIFGIMIARRSKDNFTELLGYAMVITILVQAFFNLAVVLGVVPTTGLTLPFISHGGSSLVVFMMIAGVLLNLARKQNAAPSTE